MDTLIWMLAFSFAGYIAGYLLCKHQFSKKLIVTIDDRLGEEFSIFLAGDLMEVKGLDQAVDLADNFLTLQLLQPKYQKDILELQKTLVHKGEKVLLEAAAEKGAKVSPCWCC